MADGETNFPWDAQTDTFISDIAPEISEKYSIDLRKLLSDPTSFSSTKGIADTIGKIHSDVDEYFGAILSNMKDEEESFTKELEALDAMHTSISQSLSSRAGIARVPVIKPADFAQGSSVPETIYLSSYDPQADSLLTKLINSSNFICDLSISYRKYALGAWVFSGNSKTWMISVKMPDSPIPAIESSLETILSLLEDAAFRISGE